jgi:hypothetical protein
MHSLTQPRTAMHSLEPQLTFYIKCTGMWLTLWHVILCLSHSDLTLYSNFGNIGMWNSALANRNRFGAKNSGMWNSALVIFRLALTNHPKVITNHPKLITNPSPMLINPPHSLPITPLSLPITHIHYQSPHFYYQSPQTLLPITPKAYQSLILLSNRRASCRV